MVITKPAIQDELTQLIEIETAKHIDRILEGLLLEDRAFTREDAKKVMSAILLQRVAELLPSIAKSVSVNSAWASTSQRVDLLKSARPSN